MLEDSFNAVEVIEMAKEIEKRGSEFYKTQAEGIEDSELKEFFSRLAEEEDYHYRRFEDLAGTIKSEVKDEALYVYDQKTSAYLRALVEFSVFPPEDEVKVESVDQAFLYAIRAEKESIIFYQEMMAHNTGETNKILSKLLQEEKQHLIDLVEQRDRLA